MIRRISCARKPRLVTSATGSSQNLATDRSRCTWRCGGSPRSELKKMKLYGPSRSTVGIELHCSHTCFYTQRKDCTQNRKKWLLKKPNARRQARLKAGAQRKLAAVACTPWL